MSDSIKGTGRTNLKREQIKKRNARPERGEKISRSGQPSLKDDIARIDQEILRLLLKRYNLASKIRQNGRMPSADEKFLREKWQASVARISKDADLSSRFFSLLQEISFLPRPEEHANQKEADLSRGAFTFKTIKKELNFTLNVPADTESACAWAYMAAASGQALRMETAPDNSPTRDCMNAFIQMGAELSRDKGLVDIRAASPMAQPDRVLYAGASKFNFFLYLAHYLGKPSRVKITGEKSLNLADFTALGHFLPTLGARMVHVVPKSNSLPVRLECSGLLPPGIVASSDLPRQFYEALLLASPFYDRPFAIDFNDYKQKDIIFAHILPILEQCGAIFTVDGASIGINPSSLKLPEQAQIPMDPVLAGFLLLFPEAAGGKAKLMGYWPNWAECVWLEKFLEEAGGKFLASKDSLILEREKGIDALNLNALTSLIKSAEVWGKALIITLAVCASLRKARLSLPPELLELSDCQDFLRVCGLVQEGEGVLHQVQEVRSNAIWNAPSAVWALALSVCACVSGDKNSFQLGNPGIVSEIWIPFWSWYNRVLSGAKEETEEHSPDNGAKSRRRIRTAVEAVIPEEKDEDKK